MTLLTEDFVKHHLKRVIDPEVSINIVDLGLIYDVIIEGEKLTVDMTLTTPGCPMEEYITGETRNVLSELGEAKQVEVNLVWEPMWSPDLINPLALKAQQMKESKIVTLDVRAALKEGKDPFGVIMEHVKKTPEDGAFRLIAPFRPTPLFNALGKQGWIHWIELEKDAVWYIWFFKADASEAGQASAQPATESDSKTQAAYLQRDDPEFMERLEVRGDTWILDVRSMTPPEPMRLTLAALERMPKNVSMIQINERAPQFLFEALEERGLAYSVEEVLDQTNPEVRTVIKYRES